MMERPMINATTGLAFRADGNFAGDGKADAAVIVKVGLVNVDGDGVEAMQWWCGAEKVVGLFGFQRVPPSIAKSLSATLLPLRIFRSQFWLNLLLFYCKRQENQVFFYPN
jgi:hypothetical protein